eukprot:scaffold302_cov247-Pinguiococcus_pyrenoidosus.AAC.9
MSSRSIFFPRGEVGDGPAAELLDAGGALVSIHGGHHRSADAEVQEPYFSLAAAEGQAGDGPAGAVLESGVFVMRLHGGRKSLSSAAVDQVVQALLEGAGTAGEAANGGAAVVLHAGLLWVRPHRRHDASSGVVDEQLVTPGVRVAGAAEVADGGAAKSLKYRVVEMTLHRRRYQRSSVGLEHLIQHLRGGAGGQLANDGAAMPLQRADVAVQSHGAGGDVQDAPVAQEIDVGSELGSAGHQALQGGAAFLLNLLMVWKRFHRRDHRSASTDGHELLAVHLLGVVDELRDGVASLRLNERRSGGVAHDLDDRAKVFTADREREIDAGFRVRVATDILKLLDAQELHLGRGVGQASERQAAFGAAGGGSGVSAAVLQ